MKKINRCGFIFIIGKPNTGKSTLINSLIRQKISIISKRSQTTMDCIQGILNTNNEQFIFLDTPGIKSKYILKNSNNLNKIINNFSKKIDVLLHLVDFSDYIKKKENFLINFSKNFIVILVINKIDILKKKSEIFEHLKKIIYKYNYSSIISISAKKKYKIKFLINEISVYLPIQNRIYCKYFVTNKPLNFIVSEILREKCFIYLNNELPYYFSIYVNHCREINNFIHINLYIFLKKKNHKIIFIGEKGNMINHILKKTKQEIKNLVKKKIHLNIFFKLSLND